MTSANIDGAGDTEGVSDEHTTSETINELICFVQQKSKVLGVDDLACICTKFYTSDKICKVQRTLQKYVKELTFLRSEIKSVAQLREEIVQLRSCMETLRGRSVSNASMGQSSVNVAAGVHPHITDNDMFDTHFPALGHSSAEVSSEVHFTGKPFVDIAQDLRSSGLISKVAKNRKPARKPVVGASAQNKSVKSVDTFCTVDLFVSRLHPETHSNKLVDCVNSIKGEIQVYNIVCEKLKSKFESLYCSYHVAIKDESVRLTEAVEAFMSADAWPSGIFVKIYFRPKNGSN